ncbi:hypothetical protein D3C77_635390 [compost metagenome]
MSWNNHPATAINFLLQHPSRRIYPLRAQMNILHMLIEPFGKGFHRRQIREEDEQMGGSHARLTDFKLTA